MNRKQLMKEISDSSVITVGVVGLLMPSKKVVGEKLADANWF